jgi:hypothetical protein
MWARISTFAKKNISHYFYGLTIWRHGLAFSSKAVIAYAPPGRKIVNGSISSMIHQLLITDADGYLKTVCSLTGQTILIVIM